MSKKIKAEWIVRPDSYTLDHASDWKDNIFPSPDDERTYIYNNHKFRQIGGGYYNYIDLDGNLKEIVTQDGKVVQKRTNGIPNQAKKKYTMISQPMGGKTPEEIKGQRDLMVEWAEKEGYEVLDTYFSAEGDRIHIFNHAGDDNASIYLLGKSIEQMALVDCVFFAWGWEKARGCCIEHEVAREYGIKCRYADEEFA